MANRLLGRLGGFIVFFLRACIGIVGPRGLVRRPGLYLEQLFFVGNRSVFIICLTALFTGLVFAIQFYFGFKVIKPDAFVGPSAALSLARELGPVFTGIVVTGRAGAAMAAELGSMRVSEQIDAMEVMAVDPVEFLVSPRIFAGLIGVPALTAIFLLVANLGSYFAGVHVLKIDPVLFYAHLSDFVGTVDLLQGMIKGAAFGLMFAAIGTYVGFTTSGGAKGVGNATNWAVVVTLVAILVSDYFLTLLIRLLFYRGVYE